MTLRKMKVGVGYETSPRLSVPVNNVVVPDPDNVARATFATIQGKLLKMAGWVRELKTKISIELPHSYPYRHVFGKALHLFGHLRS